MASRYESSKYLYWTRKMEEGEEKAIRSWLRRLRPPIIDVGSGTGKICPQTLRSRPENSIGC